ncbi:unnamed protein product [Didymodactylos carnosus]|uniref:Uncharacterized protein n=1 Tax=Didymodactylos carnosus TaxID=1234261 RepID=A0A813T386_9BILA|nr:unnamed protein product [Didymodactylos carnosus]CAF0805662.1 unnamed protein product [Didymodactylos carnosus]CAF3575062.1 unnamed protein product [Didymodactylos carnosus]CAF3591053.1 unnamed protein product [Didymodactylos carnosus]
MCHKIVGKLSHPSKSHDQRKHKYKHSLEKLKENKSEKRPYRHQYSMLERENFASSKEEINVEQILLKDDNMMNFDQNTNSLSNRNSFNSDSSLDSREIEDVEIPEKLIDTRAMVRDHFCMAIIGLLCFFPTGIFGLVRATQAYEMKRPSSLVFWPKLAAIYGRHALRW